MSAKYLEWARQQEKNKNKSSPMGSSSDKSHKVKNVNTRKQNNPDDGDEEDGKTIDLSSAQPSKSSNSTGRCEGCGKEQSQKRFITNEFLCPDCRDDLRYKLITKSTVARLYPLLTVNDLKEAISKQRIRCYKTKNWHNPHAAPIKLFYEQEIMDLSKRKERKTTSRSRSKLKDDEDRHHKHQKSESHHHRHHKSSHQNSYSHSKKSESHHHHHHHQPSHQNSHPHHTSNPSSINLQIEKV